MYFHHKTVAHSFVHQSVWCFSLQSLQLCLLFLTFWIFLNSKNLIGHTGRFAAASTKGCQRDLLSRSSVYFDNYNYNFGVLLAIDMRWCQCYKRSRMEQEHIFVILELLAYLVSSSLSKSSNTWKLKIRKGIWSMQRDIRLLILTLLLQN